MIKLDKRHSIAQEWSGRARQQWVFRFCGDWVSSHPTKREALDSARKWETQRQSAMLQEAQRG